jgi:hypothetical protein
LNRECPLSSTSIDRSRTLNNPFPEWPASRHHVGGNAAAKQSKAKQSSENEDAKKLQLARDHPEVVTGAAQHCVHRVAQP